MSPKRTMIWKEDTRNCLLLTISKEMLQRNLAQNARVSSVETVECCRLATIRGQPRTLSADGRLSTATNWNFWSSPSSWSTLTNWRRLTSTLDSPPLGNRLFYKASAWTELKTPSPTVPPLSSAYLLPTRGCLLSRCLATNTSLIALLRVYRAFP
jgi:hypothetical protein